MADNNGNGHNPLVGYDPGSSFGPEEDMLSPEETQAFIRLVPKDDKDGSVVTMGKATMGVLATTINFPDDLKAALALGDIENYEERDDLIAAIQERRLVGASMEPIMVYLAASCGTNKRGRWNNRVAQVYDAISHQKQTTYTKGPSGKSSRSSISD